MNRKPPKHMDCKTSSGLQVEVSSRVYSSPWQATVANPAPDEHTRLRQSFEDFVGQETWQFS